MTRSTRKNKPDLTESWGTVEGDEGDEEYNPDSGSSADEEVPHTQGRSPIESAHLAKPENYDRPTPLPTRSVVSSARSSKVLGSLQASRYAEAKFEPTTPVAKRITRSNSRTSSVEPELVMPSMNNNPMASSWSNTTPRSIEQLSRRKRQPSAGSDSPSKSPAGRPSKPRPSKQKWTSPEPAPDSGSELADLWSSILFPCLKFLASTFGQALLYLKPIIAVLLATWILKFSLQYYLGSLTSVFTLFGAVPSPCQLPVVSLLPMCGSSRHHAAGPVEFDQLMTVQSAFDEVLSSSAEGANLPLDMKRSEASIRDLKHVVRYSTLPSRNELVFEFTGFIETARQASSDLTRFNSRIGRAVDHILNTNRWTLRVIEDVAEREASRGTVARFLDNNLPFPFRSARLTEDVLLQQYLTHTRAVEEQIASLILEATALLGILQNLDDRLDVIAGIVTRDGISVKGSRDELFAHLWTKLGGNRGSVNKFNEQLRLLREVSVYRKTAWAHVSATVLKLQAIAAGLEDLRERVSEPEVVGKTVPLLQHIENIQSGVERLEAQREEARLVQGDSYRRILERAEVGEGRMIEGKKVVDVKLG